MPQVSIIFWNGADGYHLNVKTVNTHDGTEADSVV